MTALALCAQDLGISVTGSDTEEVFVTDETLKRRGIRWRVGFKKGNLEPRPDLVVFTGAHGGYENPEIKAAQEQDIPVMPHAKALAAFMEDKDAIVTAGVGGKSTIAAMIAHILDRAGKKPSFAVGVGDIPSLGVPGRYEVGQEFVTEGDEFVISPGTDERPRFHLLSPRIAVLTNIEHDHPDVYPSLSHTMDAFLKFAKKVPRDGLLVANLGNQNVRNLIEAGLPADRQVETFGAPDADWKIESLSFSEGKTTFNITGRGVVVDKIELLQPGKFNAMNALAAFVVANHLGIPAQKVKEALATFRGTARRFEKVGEAGGVQVFDDYAHHPLEIRAAIEAAREWFPKRRLVTVFQPHTYTRTKALFSDFARALAQADVTAVMDIYSSAREKKDPEVSSEALTKEITKYNRNAYYTKGHKSTVDWLLDHVESGDIILTLGAGDIFYIHEELLKELKKIKGGRWKMDEGGWKVEDGDKVQENISLAEYTTLKIGGAAKYLVIVDSEEGLRGAIGRARGKKIPFMVIGSGSNLLVNDKGYEGLIIKNSIAGIDVRGATISVKGGTLLQELVDTANRHGLAGVERLTDIPGTVAGAIYGNAGAYGQTISDRLVKVRVFNGEQESWWSKEKCGFEYRHSKFKGDKNMIILEAEFELEQGIRENLEKISHEILQMRRVKYPEGLKSPGSFFKNLVAVTLSESVLGKIPQDRVVYGKVPAGYLLESVAAKGKRRGNVKIATYHGNLFLNEGGGTAEDFYSLAKEYKDKVKEKYGIELETEVQLVGFKKGL